MSPLLIIFMAAASINIAGMLGLGWFAAEMLAYDGVVMVYELSICVGLIALLALLTGAALALKRRGKIGAAITLLSVGALPTLFVYGFLVYLEYNPIDWR